MVSGAKVKHFKDRVDSIYHAKQREIYAKDPEVKSDWVGLIIDGKGVMKPEEDIRAIIGQIRERDSCPRTVDPVRFFEFSGEKAEAEAAEKARNARVAERQAELDALHTKALDMVFFASDAECLAIIHEMEAF